MSALNTDLYELTMAAGYFAERKTAETATFELSVRRLPETRNFLIAAGLAQAVEYLRELRFKPEEIDYLRGLAQFKQTPPEFFDFLAKLRFTGDLFALPEGTPVFANEPIAIVRAPLVEAQLVETYLLSTFMFQTMVASKAARCVLAAEGRTIVEFGSRRAHSPGAGILAGRAAFVGGCSGTSNAEAGMRLTFPCLGQRRIPGRWRLAMKSAALGTAKIVGRLDGFPDRYIRHIGWRSSSGAIGQAGLGRAAGQRKPGRTGAAGASHFGRCRFA